MLHWFITSACAALVAADLISGITCDCIPDFICALSGSLIKVLTASSDAFFAPSFTAFVNLFLACLIVQKMFAESY